MKTFRLKILLVLISLTAILIILPASAYACPPPSVSLYYVSDDQDPGNYDIYRMCSDGNNEAERLTTDEAIDNHPKISPDGQVIVFSSNRYNDGGNPTRNFQIFIADPTNIDGTAVQLTFGGYPSRHPHFSPDGTLILIDSKKETLRLDEPISDQCSIPTPPDLPPDFTYRHEGMEVIRRTTVGAKFEPPESTKDIIPIEIISLSLTSADPTGVIWPPATRTYAGHPSFSLNGSRIVFSGSVDGQGNNWEVYTADVTEDLNGSLNLSNLNRVTNGPVNENANPIKMSGGAHFSNDGSQIIFTSTRNAAGISNLYKVGANASNIPVSSAQQITDGNGNDYVPEPLEDGRILITSDRPPEDEPQEQCPPSTDLDLFLLDIPDTNSNNIPDEVDISNLTDNENADEMLLIGDEVSWFCGLPRNLSPCKYYPKIMTLEQLKIMVDQNEREHRLPPNFPFRDLYQIYADKLLLLSSIIDKPVIGDPGEGHNIVTQAYSPSKSSALQQILQELENYNESNKNKLVVVPTVMPQIDNQAPSEPTNPSPADGWFIDSFFDVWYQIELNWSPSTDDEDENDDTVTYDVYLGTTPDPVKIIAADSLESKFRIDDGTLLPGVTYYWKVVAKDSFGGQTDGPVWSFTTHLLPSARNSKIDLKASPGQINEGKSSLLHGKIRNVYDEPIRNINIEIQKLVNNSWQPVKQLASNTGGVFDLRVSPKQTTSYRAVFSGDNQYNATSSDKVTVKVKTKKQIKIEALDKQIKKIKKQIKALKKKLRKTKNVNSKKKIKNKIKSLRKKLRKLQKEKARLIKS